MHRIKLATMLAFFTLTIVVTAMLAPLFRREAPPTRGDFDSACKTIFDAGGIIDASDSVMLVHLARCSVSDGVLVAIRDIDPVERVDLANTGITNDQLQFLRYLRADEIDLTGNLLDLSAIDDLRRYLDPDCEIKHD